MNYEKFLEHKRIEDPETGINGNISVPEIMMPHQSDITKWALRRGRAAIFAGTGLGKTLMELSWADIVNKHTGKPVLIFAPLAVSDQHVREAVKFGMSAELCDEQPSHNGVFVTNYQKIDHFDLSKFGGVAIDESSILKNVDGKYRNRLIEECSSIPFRLAATATPSPNDFMELGNHAEFIGAMRYTDMLSTFFTHDGGETQKWRLKGHAESEFWRWMASWSVMLRSPSDLGYSNDGYDLPPLNYHHHKIDVDYAPNIETGTLFPIEARTLGERLSARRSTLDGRVDLAASLTPSDRPFVWWCHLNTEAESLVKKIDGAVNLQGSDSDDDKRRKLIDFSDGKIRVLVSKPSIAGFGMNWQHCADTGFVGLNDSFEQVYQAIRRFWRFGQKNPVNVHFIASEMEGAVVANIKRKEADAERMAASMVMYTSSISSENIRGHKRTRADYNPVEKIIIPEWI